jgi:hypothetical protein
MKRPGHPFLLSELEMARFLKLVKDTHDGRVRWTARAEHLLRQALFPMGAEFLAALAPMRHREDGRYSLAAPLESRCWPEGAETTADTRFAPGEVRVAALTGTWEDGNGCRAGFGWGAAVAGRIWRRPGEPVDAMEAGLRLLALMCIAMLQQRDIERDRAPDDEEGAPPDTESAAQPAEPQAAGGGAAPADAVAAALAAGVTGDDIRLVAAFAQHHGPRVAEAVAEMGETSAAVAELVVAFSRLSDLLLGDRGDRIAALLDHAATAADRSAEVRAIAKSRRRPPRATTCH